MTTEVSGDGKTLTQKATGVGQSPACRARRCIDASDGASPPSQAAQVLGQLDVGAPGIGQECETESRSQGAIRPIELDALRLELFAERLRFSTSKPM